MASPDLAKFGGHRDCGSRDIFLVVEEQDSICSFNSTTIISSKVRGMLCLYIQKFTIKIALPKSYVRLMNTVRSWSHASRVTNDELYAKKTLSVTQKRAKRRKKRKRTTKKTNAKLCVLFEKKEKCQAILEKLYIES